MPYTYTSGGITYIQATPAESNSSILGATGEKPRNSGSFGCGGVLPGWAGELAVPFPCRPGPGWQRRVPAGGRSFANSRFWDVPTDS